MIVVSQDIHSMTAFKRDTTGLMKRMKKTQRPLVLTVKGKAEAVIMDPEVYQKMANCQEAVKSLRRGIAQARKGMGRSIDEVFDDMEHTTAGKA